ncbi:cupin domain-containing protein, partial [Xanthomonas oryzae pv. oryzae]
MNLFANALLLSMMAAGGPGEAATPIKVNKACGAPSAVGSAEYFTGKV